LQYLASYVSRHNAMAYDMRMARAYLTEKQMPHNFWFYAITHTPWMMNAIPGKYKNCLVLPFLLVHGVRHDERT
jgi:hypothetical protein